MTQVTPHHFQGAAGPLLGVYHAPTGHPPRGTVLHLPAFAEEANASRRLVSQAAQAMAREGWGVLLFDLWGCGDSGGDLTEARWDTWRADAQAAANLLQTLSHSSHAMPTWLWGCRSGALLARDLASRAQVPPHLLLWQPQWSGKQVLQTWLRVHAAHDWLQAPSTGDSDQRAPQTQWDAGNTLELGGYPVTPQLAADLQAQTAEPLPAGASAQWIWLDVHLGTAPDSPPRGTLRVMQAWAQSGWQVRWIPMDGPAYWLSIGTDECTALLSHSVQALQSPPL